LRTFLFSVVSGEDTLSSKIAGASSHCQKDNLFDGTSVKSGSEKLVRESLIKE